MFSNLNDEHLQSHCKLYLASGEQYAAWAVGKSLVPDSNTSFPGRNFRQFGLGVSWVCINIVLTAANKAGQIWWKHKQLEQARMGMNTPGRHHFLIIKII